MEEEMETTNREWKPMYSTITLQQLNLNEELEDSDGESDIESMRIMMGRRMEKTDGSPEEKEIMKLWNLYFFKHPFVGDCRVPGALEKFVEDKGTEILDRHLYNRFVILLANFFDFGLLSPLDMYKTIEKLQNLNENSDAYTHTDAVPIFIIKKERKKPKRRKKSDTKSSTRRKKIRKPEPLAVAEPDLVADGVQDLVADGVQDLVANGVQDLVADRVQDLVADGVQDLVADGVQDPVAVEVPNVGIIEVEDPVIVAVPDPVAVTAVIKGCSDNPIVID